MAAVIYYLDPTTDNYVQIPIRPTASVISVNGQNGVVNLQESDIPNLTTDLNQKLDKPTSTGSVGDYLTIDSTGKTIWADTFPVNSVNGKTGTVVLHAADINMADGTTVEAKINSKANTVSGGVAGQVLTMTSTGNPAWTTIAGGVSSVNTKTGNVVLNATDIKMSDGTTVLETKVNSKLDEPTGSRAVGYSPIIDSTGNLVWGQNIVSVNGKTGTIVLKAEDIKLNNGSTLEYAVTNKVDAPANTVTTGAVLTKTATGTSWIIPTGGVSSVNTKTGVVTLTGADIDVSASNTSKLSNAVLDVKLNGTVLTKTNNAVDIPIAGTTIGTSTSLGVVNVDADNGIIVDSNGVLKSNDKLLNCINGAYKTINAAEYDEAKMYQVGDYVTYKGRFYVCKTSNSTGVFTVANFYETSASAEMNNMLSYVIDALGLQEGLRRWDSTNNKIIYDFTMK